jgi:hypothetical protein
VNLRTLKNSTSCKLEAEANPQANFGSEINKIQLVADTLASLF